MKNESLQIGRLFLLVLLCISLTGVGRVARAGDREEAKVLLQSAETNLKKGDFATAEEMCTRALASDKDYGRVHLVMGQCYEGQNKAREAINEYNLAAELSLKDKTPDRATADQATGFAKKLAPGLLEIKQADQRLATKLTTLASGALAESQLDTAKSAYQELLALNPSDDDARKNLDEVQKRIDERGDPIKGKIAAAGMSEVYYELGTGSKDKAREQAQEIAQKFSDTSYGKDASHLLSCNFDLSKTIEQDLKDAKEQIKQLAAAQKKPTPAATTSTQTSPPSTSSTPSHSVAPQQGVDIDGVERQAEEDAKKLPKDKLVSTFSETFKAGKEFYSKATPVSEGNQKNVAAALTKFIGCEALYMQIDTDKLMTPDVEAQEKDASMLRYACMKMTILSH